MKLLLDTHIILWTLNDNLKLSQKAKEMILDARNEIFYSTASVWEVAIKHMAKPDKIKISGEELSNLCRKMGYHMLPIADNHVKELETLFSHDQHQKHNDPFDRIMIAQAKAEGLMFVTHDSKIPLYRETCVIEV